MVGLETVGTNGTDDYGFSLLPLGYILGSEEGQIHQFVDAGKWPDHGVTAITQNAYLKTSTMEQGAGLLTYRVCAGPRSIWNYFGLLSYWSWTWRI